jgi:hypothetical protein
VKELPHTYLIGKSRKIHAGFAVHKIIGRLDKPMERVGPIWKSAEKAVEAAERLGDGYAAFRVVQSKAGTSINGRIRREDLPVTIR